MHVTKVQASLKLNDERIKLKSLYCAEGISAPFEAHITVLIEDNIEPSVWLGVLAQLQIQNDLHAQTVYQGVITSVSVGDVLSDGQIEIALILRSRIKLLNQFQSPKVILNQSWVTVSDELLLAESQFSLSEIFHHFIKTHPISEQIIQGFQETSLQFLNRLCADAKSFYWESREGVHLCDHSGLCRFLTDRAFVYQPDVGEVYRVWMQQTPFAEVLHLLTRAPELRPGGLISLDLSASSVFTSGEYLVISVAHYLKQISGAQRQGAVLVYWNEVVVQAQSQPYQPPPVIPLQMPWCFLATVESHASGADLTDNAEYRLRFGFDLLTNTQDYASKPIPRMHASGGSPALVGASGIHLPLKNGVSVLVTCANGDVNQPVILAALPSEVMPSPVNDLNATQSVLKTKRQQGLVFDDRLLAQQLSLYNESSSLTMMHQPKRAWSKLLCEQGGVIIFAGKNSEQFSGGQMKIIAGETVEKVVRGRCRLAANQSDFYYQAGINTSMMADKQLSFSAENLQFNAAASINISALSDVHFNSGLGDQYYLAKNQFSLIGRSISVSAKDRLVLRVGSSACVLTPAGIWFYGRDVLLNATYLALSGQVQFVDAQRRYFNRLPMPAVRPLPWLQKCTDALSCHISDCRWQRPVARIGESIIARCFVENINKQQQGTLIVSQSNHQVVARKSFSVSAVRAHRGDSNVSLAIPWQVSQTASGDQSAKTQHQVIQYYFSVKIGKVTNHLPSDALMILTDLNISVSFQKQLSLPDGSMVSVLGARQHFSRSAMQQGKAFVKNVLLGEVKVALALLNKPAAIQSARVSTQQHYLPMEMYDAQSIFPESFIKHALKADLQQQSLHCDCIMPPKVCVLSEKFTSQSRLCRQALTDFELKQFAAIAKMKPKNITVFVHGFNVPLGAYGEHIAAVSEDGSVTLEDNYATCFRTMSQLKSRFPRIDLSQCADVNGSGAHAWLLAMEYYLNKACGFKEGQYDDYARLLGAFWYSSSDNAMDYMSVTRWIKSVGVKLAALLAQLLEAGFEVNIIAHSLGNGVVMHALNQLHLKTPRQINHYFMWQAAIPNTIFSNKNAQDGLWSVPYAHLAAKKFIVLTSLNDNVLGPIPKKQVSGLSQFYVNAQKPIMVELLPAVLLTYLGLGSLYHAAMAIAVPISDFLNPNNFEIIYQNWRQCYPAAKDRQGRYFPGTFKERVFQVESEQNAKIEQALKNRFEANKSTMTRYLRQAKKRLKSGIEKTMIEGILFLLSNIDRLSMYYESLGNMFSPRPIFVEPEIGEDKILHWFKQCFILLNTFFYESDITYTPALGYVGVAASDPIAAKLMAAGKLIQVDQSDCLFDHSGMKNPNKRLFEKSFKKAVWQDNPDFHFGHYEK